MPIKAMVYAVMAKGRKSYENLAAIKEVAERAISALMEENKTITSGEFDLDMAHCIYLWFNREDIEAAGGVDDLYTVAMARFEEIFAEMAKEELPHLVCQEESTLRFKKLQQIIKDIRNIQENLPDAMKVDRLHDAIMAKEWITEKQATQYFYEKCSEMEIKKPDGV